MWRLLVQTAWRNLWRNKRRSWLTIGAITFALTLALVQRGIQIGTYELNIAAVTNFLTGHLQLQHYRYRDVPTLRNSFILSDTVYYQLRQVPTIQVLLPRILAGGLLSNREQSFGIVLWGIEAQIEQQWTTLPQKIRQGRWLQAPGEAIVGATLLKNLNLHIGDSAIILAPGYDGLLGNRYIRIVGTFQTGSQELDRMGVILHRSDADQLLGMNGRITHLLIHLSDFDALAETMTYLAPIARSHRLQVLQWDEVIPAMKQMIELDNISGILFLTILLVVVAFGIANTLLMAISERFREFGVLLAIGMENRHLALMISFETVWMILIGISIGSVLGNGIVWYFHTFPVTFSGELADIYREFGFLPQLTATMKWSIFRESLFLLVGISLLAAIYPISRTLRLEPLKGIRYT